MAGGLRRLCFLSPILLVALAGCAPRPPTGTLIALQPAGFADLAGWQTDDQAAALGAFRRSCARIARRAAGKPLAAAGTLAGRAGDWRAVCRAAAALPPGKEAAARRFFENHFRAYAVFGPDGPDGLFTGYYEPEVDGARQPGRGYGVPLYRKPDDLISASLGRFRGQWQGDHIAGRLQGNALVPYHDRQAINAGALAGRGLELLWLKDPVEAFFLQVQGSGRVRLEDGTVVRVGYAGRNGHPYKSIGRELISQGEITKQAMSMAAIRAWIAANPGPGARLMEANPSYVFFRELTGDGPIGAEGVALTAGRSLAVDGKLIPYGVPVWVDTTDPLNGGAPLRRLMVAQDTGGAITGAVRGDLFWGAGEQAAARAGAMSEGGRYFILLPKSLAPRPGS